MLSRNSTNGRSQVRMKKEEGGSAYRLDYNNIIFLLVINFFNGKVFYEILWIFFQFNFYFRYSVLLQRKKKDIMIMVTDRK